MTVLAEGRTAEGEHWTLTSEAAAGRATVGLHVTRADGHRFWGTGCGLRECPQSEPVHVTTGSDHEGPSTLLLQLRADVRAVVVTLSDGTREDLRVLAVPGRPDIRVAALAHPRRLDVHRIDLYDRSGTRLPDPAPHGA
jgi:hypothetical protein